ncbi:hypothetical protein MKQ68_08875 [Chitinophaga horti]|uniref:Uncharacterized protein n=1 Tax=Chitinophaga horti TaxID=2920382 RepID=A0ABY6JA39_9BACT|nr:hypothetical protein [Chitinophaga horti]UYQ95207.1 hypothetical protein MKQ68_08875 [Chitinophaga horti]
MHQVNLQGNIGPFFLNTPFYPHLESFGVATYTPGAGERAVYTFDKEATALFTVNGIIKGIACAANCALHGLGLIGLEAATALALMKGQRYELEHVVFADGSEQAVYCFEAGLQLWIGDNGRVVKVFLGDYN